MKIKSEGEFCFASVNLAIAIRNPSKCLIGIGYIHLELK